MKRLIDSKKRRSFKNWIIQHDPKYKWDFDNPTHLREQFCNVIGESGDIDLRTIFETMFVTADPGLNVKQISLFQKEIY